MSGYVKCVSIPLFPVRDTKSSYMLIDGSEAEIFFTDLALEDCLVLFGSLHKQVTYKYFWLSNIIEDLFLYWYLFLNRVTDFYLFIRNTIIMNFWP